MCACKISFWYDTYSIIEFFHFTSDFYQFCDRSLQMLRNNIQYRYISLCCCCCEHECSCFDLIRDHRIFCSVKALYTTDLDHICTCSPDVGSHAVQEVRNIYNMWLFCNIFQNGKSFCHSCCHHNVNRCSNTYHVEINMLSDKTVCLCNDLAMFNIYICT